MPRRRITAKSANFRRSSAAAVGRVVEHGQPVRVSVCSHVTEAGFPPMMGVRMTSGTS
jgi:hypothetical protein